MLEISVRIPTTKATAAAKDATRSSSVSVSWPILYQNSLDLSILEQRGSLTADRSKELFCTIPNFEPIQEQERNIVSIMIFRDWILTS